MMDTLPTEILLHILTFLKVTELGIFIQACKGFYEHGNPIFQNRKSQANVNIFTAFGPAHDINGNLYCLQMVNHLNFPTNWIKHTTKVDLPGAGHSLISYKNRYIYTIGGIDAHTNDVTVYDTKMGTFHSKSQMRKSHYNSIQSARIHDKIYVIDQNSEVYSIESDTWQPFNSIVILETNFSLTSSGTNLIITGGKDFNHKGKIAIQSSGYMWDIVTQKEIPLPDMLKPKFDHTSVVVDYNLLFAIGGAARGNEMEKLDLREGKWTKCKNMSAFRSDPSAVGFNNNIWVTGGAPQVERYDIRNDTWEVIAELPKLHEHVPLCYTISV